MAFALTFTASAQKSNHEGYIGATAIAEDIPTGSPRALQTGETDYSPGLLGEYTMYFRGKNKANKGNLGLTGSLGINFKRGKMTFATLMYGLTYKKRNYERVQPYVRVLGGFTRSEFGHYFVNGVGLRENIDSGLGFTAGAGVDLRKKDARLGLRVGADYINANSDYGRTHNVRFNAGVVF